jgi:multidrug resistance efflux pump
MVTEPASQLLAQVLQITVDVAKDTNLTTARQLLAAKLAALFRADRVLLVATTGKAKLIASDSYTGRPPANAYSDELLMTAAKMKAQADGDSCFEQQNLWLALGAGQALLLQRPAANPWQAAELQLLKQVAPALAASIRPSRESRQWRQRRWAILALVLAALMLPVPDTVVAPALVESQQADQVYAPLSGVVETLLVKPGATVEAGDLLLRYQQRDWQQQRRQALREQQLAEAELERLSAAAWQDSQARAAMPAQQLRIEQATQQLSYLETLLADTEVRAEQAGTLLLDDAQELSGALVQAGELLFTVADAEQLRLKLNVSVADFGKLAPGGTLHFRTDAAPFKRWSATLSHLGAEVQLSEQQQPSIVAMASFAEPSEVALRLGERGTARIDAGWTLLGIKVFRKPWQQLRRVLPF